MAGTLNKAILVGRLGKDPEMRYIPSGKAITSFSLATDHSYKKGEEWINETDWHNVECWGDLAERMNARLKKGSLVAVEGEIRYESWTGEDGVKKYKTKIVADTVKPLDKKDSQPSEQRDQGEQDVANGVQIPMGSLNIPIP